MRPAENSLTTTCPLQVSKTTRSALVMTKGQAKPEQIWDLLPLDRQQKVLQAIVLVCHGLISPPAGCAQAKEVRNEHS